MATLDVASPAPDFVLPSSEGGTFQLSQQRGRWVVLYFYPKDFTPGCTTEACEFRDLLGDLLALGAVVVGVSADSAARHQAFSEKHGLSFPLLSDEDGAVAKTYGAYGEKTFMGRKSVGVLRTTYLIDPEGRVARVWEKVKAAGHAAEVLEALRKLVRSG
ncbi:MAG: thioredoxin-dependent thiol peroxidase [Thermoanaerobaculum sp.]|nr:thioredoxin-dependent thiol peroxidase [Thermoanaerobaculum sp.]MCX7896067.1 thioredoxin-dependent thiol peroxidase [Thermoanaerobaculum sp.]MDW7967987.1 thioredoxin-dependent thiol peroxidase [Thermoanaerobaculum sp.]